MKIETDINKLTSETHNNLFVNTGCWAQNYTNISPVEVNAFSILTS